MKDLDIGYLAQSFTLFRLPRITEIIGKNIQNFKQSELDIDLIPYEDKHLEKKRLAVL